MAGTASAVAGRVQRRQARKFAESDAQVYAQREQAYEQQMAGQNQYQQPAPPPEQYQQPAPPPAAAPQTDVITQLKELAELRDQGVLTDDEFATQKARILA
ncbi:SHOCT domain-containing protein [Pseudonocardia sp.]|uniref:SHOCT domain-containing protein n=1 Tax=Pseudonocardia sp. TaxID=60912 RepID=UPI003D113EB2